MKRFIINLTSLLFTFAILGWSSSTNAQGYSGGNGSIAFPYQIHTLADLGYLSAHSEDWTLHFVQTADIDAAATSGWDGGQGFSPIGMDPVFTSIPSFDGSYDGQNHVITNLFINRPGTDNVGLFGYVPGIIRNLGVTDAVVSGHDFVGALGGEVFEADNCHTSGNVTGNDNVGGFIGNVLISNLCYSSGSVTGNNYVGGFAADNIGGNTYNCYATANVSGNTNVGGFFGTVTGVVQYCYSTGLVSGGSEVGGLIGSDSGGFADNSFWDVTTSGQLTSAKGNGRTTAQLKRVGTYLSDPSLFTLWDFDSADYKWAFNGTDNNGYPFLRFENHVPADIWLGTNSTDWSDGGNWSENAFPVAGDKVFIPEVVTDPVISTTQLATNLIIETGGHLTIGSAGKLTVPTALANNSLASDFVIENGGSLVTNGTISGTATVNCEIAGDLGWHLLSSPVASQPICDGTFAPLISNFSTTPSTSYDFYKFQPDPGTLCGGSDMWVNLRKSDLTPNTADFGAPPQFDSRRGYLVAYALDFPTTKVFTGALNTGDQAYSMTTALTSCPWNLLGNPFPSAINWDLITDKSSLFNGYYYIYNENKAGGPGYESYLDATHKTDGVNGKIAAMQGFFVQASGASFTIPNTARTNDGDLWLKKQAAMSKLTLTLSNSSYYDQAYILFESNTNQGSDWFDAVKMLTMDKKVPQIYSIVGNDQKTQINSMLYMSNPFSVPLGIVAPADGSFSIRVTGMETLAEMKTLAIEDTRLHVSQNLLANPVYTFEAAGNEDAARFILHFDGEISSLTGNDQVKIFVSDGVVNVLSPNGLQHGQVTITNITGQQVITQKLSDQTLNQISLDAANGYYIVKVESDNIVKISRVYFSR